MANSEQRIRAFIKSEKSSGKSDAQIVVAATKLSGQAGKDVNEFIKQTRAAGLSPTQEFGKYFGLSTAPVDPKSRTKNKSATAADKVKSANYSAMSGVAKSFGGVAQALNSGLDAVSGGINKAVGTKLPTGNRASYDRDVNSMTARKEQLRDQANYSGMDLSELGGEIAAKAPLYVAGGAPKAGIAGLAKFAGREAALGAVDGASRFAKNGDEKAGNVITGAVGGGLGGVVGVGIGKTIGAAIKKGSRVAANKSGRTATAATKLVDDAIAETGIRVNATSRTQLVNDATKNLSKSKQVDAAAAVRKSLLEQEGFKGTNAQVNKNAQNWTVERQAAKSSPDLNDVHVGNNEQLTSKWENLVDETGATPTDNVSRMESTFQTLKQGDEVRQADIGAKYAAAREMSGNDLPLNHVRFIDQASREIEKAGKGTFIPPSITRVFNEMFGDPNNARFTYEKSEALINILNAEFKKADRADDGNVKWVIGAIRDNLNKEVDNSIADLSGSLGQGASDGGLAGTQGAWNTARGAAKDRFQDLDSNPALKAALDDASPDKSFNKIVLNSDKRDLIKLVDGLKGTPQGQQNLADLQGATIEHFIKKATGADNGAFNTAMLNKAIDGFSPEKMKVLFSPEQIARINDIRQVGDILMQRPQGAHINDSNTASTLINKLIGVASITGRVPMLGNLGIGAAKAIGDLSQSGAGTKMINGQAAITKGSSLGLTDEQMRLLGLMSSGGQAGAAVGASLGN